MKNYLSPKWRLFVSRPTPILKRDLYKWAYLSLAQISGMSLTKVIAIASEGEMDIFLPQKEDRKNYIRITKTFETGKLEKEIK